MMAPVGIAGGVRVVTPEGWRVELRRLFGVYAVMRRRAKRDDDWQTWEGVFNRRERVLRRTVVIWPPCKEARN